VKTAPEKASNSGQPKKSVEKEQKGKEKKGVYFLLDSRATPSIAAMAGTSTSGIGNHRPQE
jgi:hypothetical protein